MGQLASRIAALAALLLLALAVASCGGDDGSDAESNGSEAAATAEPGGEKAPSAGDREDAGSSSEREGDASGPESAEAEHGDSGGGAAEFRVKGGDNSVQEFGSEAAADELEAAATALHGFLDARADGNWAAACEHVSTQIAESLRQLAVRASGGNDCATLMRSLSAGVPASVLAEAAEADVGAMRVEGDRAFLLYHGAGGTDYAIPMTVEGDEWKVGALAGVPLN